MYKLTEFGVIRLEDNAVIPNDPRNTDYARFLEMLDEQGNMDNVENPDVVEPDCAELRRGEYPSVADQLDAIYHMGIDGWKAQIAAIKQKYPTSIQGGVSVSDEVPQWLLDDLAARKLAAKKI